MWCLMILNRKHGEMMWNVAFKKIEQKKLATQPARMGVEPRNMGNR